MCYLECNQEEFCLAFAAIGATCYRCMADGDSHTDGVLVPQANQSLYRIWSDHLDSITRTYQRRQTDDDVIAAAASTMRLNFSNETLTDKKIGQLIVLSA